MRKSRKKRWVGSPRWSSGQPVCHWTQRSQGSDPAEDDGFLRAIEIRSTPFGGEVKLEAPCRKILRHAKKPFVVWQRYVVKLNSSFPSPSSSCFATRWLLVGLPESSDGWIRSFCCRSLLIIIYHLGDEQYARWWPQFGDLVSTHRHDHHHHF
jgi:hypothetical protein